MTRLILSGAYGRMGRLVAQEAPAQGFEAVAGIDPGKAVYADFPVFPDFGDVIPEADALIDFSTPAALGALLDYARVTRLPCVLCATGYGDEHMALIRETAREIPILQSANMSRGVYAMRKLAALARSLLPGFDVEIVEKHHNQKADAPSGTAYALLDAVRDEGTRPVFGREGMTGKRSPDEIGVHAVRGGTVSGEHEVGFYGKHEVVTLTHTAQSPLIFAYGALSAAKWLIGQKPGLYGMDDLMKE